MAELVEIEADAGIATVTIRRPPANALDPELLAAGSQATAKLRELAPDAVVLQGAGGFFSAGIDLKLVPALAERDQRAMVAAINRLFYDWYGLGIPMVAAVNGHAVAGGMIWALCADHRVGSLEASYGLTELRVGAPYPVCALAVVRAELGPGAARRLALGAELAGADAALGFGLVDEVAEPDDVAAAALAAARRLAELPGETYARVKAQLREPALATMRAGLEHDPLADGWLSAESADAASSTLERRT